MPAGMPRFAPNQTPPISALPHHSPPAAHGNPSGHALRRARPIPAAPRQPTALPSVCNGRSCLNEICLPAAIVQDRPTLSRPIARGLRQPRDNLNHLCNWAPSTMPRLPPTPRPPPRPTTRCAAHCVANAVPTSVSQRFDHRDRQPGRLVFGLRRIAAIDTSNPNQKLHTRQHQMHILHNPSVGLWMDSDSTSTD